MLRALPSVAPAALLAALAAPAGGWTPASQVTIADEAARLAPPDLYRLIDRHRRQYHEGVRAPFEDGDPARHEANPDGTGVLDRVILAEVEGAVRAIVEHRPFAEVVYRLGVVSHYLADANNPLAASAADPDEGRYFADFLRYAESAEPRFQLIFYGLKPEIDRGRDFRPLLAETLKRSRELYPLVSLEYRRVGFAPGRTAFDDRSTAFGVAALAFSHGVSDVALALRYVWLKAGGADQRSYLPSDGKQLLLYPRGGRVSR